MIARSLLRVLDICAEELADLDADWAVAGATALAVHGYERTTKDVDLFIADEAREQLLERLAKRRLPVADIFPPTHFSVAPIRARDPEIRIDLLFPALGVECLGLMAARIGTVARRQLPVVPLHHLIAAKLLVEPSEDRERYEKDMQDLRELRLRGMIDVSRVETVLDDVGEPAAVARLLSLMNAVAP